LIRERLISEFEHWKLIYVSPHSPSDYEAVKRWGWEIDFKHPKMKVEEPAGYFLSSVEWDKKRNVLRTTVRTPVPTYKELYLDYCVEDGVMVCRPHFWSEKKIVSVQATFSKEPLDRFNRLLVEMLDPPEKGMDLCWLPIAFLFLIAVLKRIRK